MAAIKHLNEQPEVTSPSGTDLLAVLVNGAWRKITFSSLSALFGLTKATGADVNTGTDDAKYVTSKAIADSNLGVFSGVDDTTILQGVNAQDTSLLVVKAGAMPATVTDTNNTGSNLVFTAVANGTSGNAITVQYTQNISTPLTVSVVGNAITIHLETDVDDLSQSDGLEVIAAIQGSAPASALITAALAPGNDGSANIVFGQPLQLAGGKATGINLLEVGNRGATTIHSLDPVIGAAILSVKDEAGNLVAHVDDDGGAGFASDNVLISQEGTFTTNLDTDGDPLAGTAAFSVGVNGSNIFAIQPGGGYNAILFSKVASDRVLALSAFTAQSANIFEARDENDVVATAIGPDGTVFQRAPASTPAAGLLNGQISFYLDEVGNKLKVAVKYSDGTAKVGEIALT